MFLYRGAPGIRRLPSLWRRLGLLHDARQPALKMNFSANKRSDMYHSYRRSFSTSSPSDSPLSSSYVRLTPVEHILLRPEMYVGQVTPTYSDTYLLDPKTGKFTKKRMNFSPALIKIFDEILVNAADNARRDANTTKVDINVIVDESNKDLLISVRNNGKGVPIETHPTENMYIPELIFGNLLTGSNFSESHPKFTGGRHGYGAKLTNIFSKRFEFETCNESRKLSYKQVWENNMQHMSAPVIKAIKTKKMEDYTQITFKPDLSRLKTVVDSRAEVGQAELSDAIAIFKRRAYDLAACVPGLKVTFNSEIIPVKNFFEYASMYSMSDEQTDKGFVVNVKLEDGLWDIVIQRNYSGEFHQISFVNSVWTPKGGSHVTAVSSQIIRAIDEHLKTKNVVVKPAAIKAKLMVFVNSLIENPTFDNQSKDSLITKLPVSTAMLPQSVLNKIVAESGIVEELISQSITSTKKSVLKPTKKGTFVEIPKLDDAHFAGTKKSTECSLILTEGDSAKALAVAGLEVVGRQRYGVLPLKGKILNVRDFKSTKLIVNEELLNICKAIGLDFQEKYDTPASLSTLRYGHVILMCDQDVDGSHIKGLVLNFFQYYWPNLLKIDDFFQQIVTPLIKVWKKGAKKDNASTVEKAFYTVQDFDSWTKSLMIPPKSTATALSTGIEIQNALKTVLKVYSVKYYKGLGTSSAAEGREYFRNLSNNCKSFLDTGNAAEMFDMAFNKSKVAARKDWLKTKYDREKTLDLTKKKISYAEFIDNELIYYAHDDNIRSIPSVIDGFKPSQRKILYSCFKRNLNSEIKVVQLAGYVSEQTAYHHGEQSLHMSIVQMAQDYVGSNNLPFLEANGQFGTRAQGGSDFASARYIFTRLSPITRFLFPEEDDNILEYCDEDGIQVEPKYFVPIIPTILINGSVGIGMGWSTYIPSYSIEQLINSVEALVIGDKPLLNTLQPYYSGFLGAIRQKDAYSFVSEGVVVRISEKAVEIRELPIGVWTAKYKEHLSALAKANYISGFTEHHTTSNVLFKITGTKDMLDAIEGAGILSYLKLSTNINLTNMHAFDQDGRIKKYESPDEIIFDHFKARLDAYCRRKLLMIQKAMESEAVYRNQARFIEDIISGNILLFGEKNSKRPSGTTTTSPFSRANMNMELKALGYQTRDEIKVLHLPDKGIKKVLNSPETLSEGYSYLMDMPIQTLVAENAQKLKESAKNASEKLKAIQNLAERQIWLQDLAKLKSKLRTLGYIK